MVEIIPHHQSINTLKFVFLKGKKKKSTTINVGLLNEFNQISFFFIYLFLFKSSNTKALLPESRAKSNHPLMLIRRANKPYNYISKNQIIHGCSSKQQRNPYVGAFDSFSFPLKSRDGTVTINFFFFYRLSLESQVHQSNNCFTTIHVRFNFEEKL